MLRKIWPFLLILFAFNAIEGNEIYSLKKTYEIKASIEGTDQSSIKEGMKKSLSSLLINLSGTSTVLQDQAIKRMMLSPETYISQYKLESEDKRIIGTFLFQGDSLRSYLSENNLPLWLAQEPLILAYSPCSDIQEESIVIEEKERCNKIREELFRLSQLRNSKIARPLMDLKDIRDLNILNSISSEKFMTKMSRRYSTDHWLFCLTRDKFGLLLDAPSCFSSGYLEPTSLDIAFNSLLNKINSKKSLLINKSKSTISEIKVIGIQSFLMLEQVLEALDSQVLIFSVSLNQLEADTAHISLSHYGNKTDLTNLLMIHTDFKEIISKSQDIISYTYTKI